MHNCIQPYPTHRHALYAHNSNLFLYVLYSILLFPLHLAWLQMKTYVSCDCFSIILCISCVQCMSSYVPFLFYCSPCLTLATSNPASWWRRESSDCSSIRVSCVQCRGSYIPFLLFYILSISCFDPRRNRCVFGHFSVALRTDCETCS